MMRLLSFILTALIVITGIEISYSDIKKGIIRNRVLLPCLLMGVSINIFCIFSGAGNIRQYMLNSAIGIVVALILYVAHYWAAGDSKLMIVYTCIFPIAFYDCIGGIFYVPAVVAFVLIFILAYMFVIGETLLLTVRKTKSYKPKRGNLGYRLKEFTIAFVYLCAVSCLIDILPLDVLHNNTLLNTLLHESKIYANKLMIAGAVAVSGGYAIFQHAAFANLNFWLYLLILGILVLNGFLGKYNYREVRTDQLKAGMILASSNMFSVPAHMDKLDVNLFSEDMRARLKPEDVNAIKDIFEEENVNQVIIVRKMPFGIFIVFGYILLCLVGCSFELSLLG